MAQPSSDDAATGDERMTEARLRLRQRDIDRLDHAAARRGVTRDEIMAQAIDGFLAREMWSGGFIEPPPPMELPPKRPDRAEALRRPSRRSPARWRRWRDSGTAV